MARVGYADVKCPVHVVHGDQILVTMTVTIL